SWTWPSLSLFFLQAEDGRRGFHVTGVQTCALPIFAAHAFLQFGVERVGECLVILAEGEGAIATHALAVDSGIGERVGLLQLVARSEERRVGQECRLRARSGPASAHPTTAGSTRGSQ